MQDAPLVSVLMTCYNREKYIAAAIESVLQSSFKDFELIICDDGSKDASVDIIKRYAATDSRIRLFQNQTNKGDYPNRNEAARHARGKYIKYVDSDDHIYPLGLEMLVTQMEAFPTAGYGLCSLPQDDEHPYPILLDPAKAYEYNYLYRGIFNKAPLSSIIRKDVFENENGFLPDRMSSDCEMWHRLSMKYNVLLMSDGVVWSRTHAGQEMSDVSSFFDVYEKITVRYLTDKNCPLPADKIAEIIRRIRARHKKSLVKNLLLLRFSAAAADQRRLKVYRKVSV